MEIRKDLHPIEKGNGRYELPPASYNLTHDEKKAMCESLRGIRVPRETQDTVKHYAKKMLGESFHRWKSELNTKYVQKGRTPFQIMGTSHHNNGKSVFGKRTLRNL